MRLLLKVSLLCLLALWVEAKDYSDHVVLSVRPTNDDQLDAVEELLENGMAQTWKRPKDGTYYLAVQKRTLQLMKEQKYDVELIFNGEQLVSMLEATKKRDYVAMAKEPRHSVTWTQYNTLDEIYEYMDEMAAANPTLASVSVLGRTWEGRELKMITFANGGDDPSRPMIVLDAGIHAREWIAPATATYIMEQLVIDPLIDDATFVIVPSLNPDGYSHTWDVNGDRLWRKTRSDRPENTCIGVDGNRNWDFHWMEIGASNHSCSEIYAGPYPNSEPEFEALADFTNDNADRIKVYVTLHSYSQLFMTPWGDTTDPPPDATELNRVAALATTALTAVHGTEYKYGSTADILGYLDAGTSRDYMYGAVNIPYVYTIELRDQGEYEFELPPDQIMATGEETWPAFRVTADEALNALKMRT